MPESSTSSGRRNETKREAARPAPPPPRTGFFFKLIGLILVVGVAYCGYFGWKHWERTGKIPDFTDTKTQQEVFEAGRKDLTETTRKTVEVSGEALEWAERSLADLAKRIKGKPPETKEEVSALVQESKEAQQREKPGAAASQGSDSDSGIVVHPPGERPPEVARESSRPTLLMQAQEAYRLGQDAYIHTDPNGSQEQVQHYLKLAKPYFSQCLDLCDQARAQGQSGRELDELEQRAAKRLFDINKRTELSLR